MRRRSAAAATTGAPPAPGGRTGEAGPQSAGGGRRPSSAAAAAAAPADHHIASTAGADTWKTWAGRSHGSDDSFEVLDLFRGVRRSLHHRFLSSAPPAGTACPVCFVEPNRAADWHVTWCGHAVCRDCLQAYASSQVLDRGQTGPLKCPVCPQVLRRQDAIVALAGDVELIRQWDLKLRNILLRALPSYRPCPKCSARGKDFDGGDSGGGGFVTPECLRPHYQERREAATRVLEHRSWVPLGIGFLYVFVVWLIAQTPSRSPLVDLFCMLVPIYVVVKTAMASQILLARAARRAYVRPITVGCPCCNEDFILPAESKELQDDETSRWMNANTRPCPSCSVPISKMGGCNHMTCSHCRANFCWACMRLRTNCGSFNCQNGAPFQNAIPQVGAAAEGDRGDRRQAPQVNDSILTVIDYWSDRPCPELHRNDGLVVLACLFLRRLTPILAPENERLLIRVTLCVAVFVVGLVLCVVLDRVVQEVRTRIQLQLPPRRRQDIGRLEQQMIDEALRRSVADR